MSAFPRLMCWLLTGAILSACATNLAAKAPNILFILVDDMGYTGVECFGNSRVKTPAIDRLATEGMRFTAAYVTPQCSPTRASLLSGQHTARNRLWHVLPGYSYPQAALREPAYSKNLSRETVTVAEALQSAGYETACFGKWHLNSNADGNYQQLNPEAAAYYGFDHVAGARDHNHGDKGMQFLTERTLEFLEAPHDKPFFLYLSHYTVHTPVAAPEELIQKYRQLGYPEAGPDKAEGRHNATYLAMIDDLNRSTGRILARLDELGLTQETVVIFLSDNGGVLRVTDNGPLRWGKGSPYEGGIRVPLIVRWPGVVAPGSTCATPVHVVDFYPTLLEIAGARAPVGQPLDGVSLLPLLRQSGSLSRDTLYWYMPLYDPQWGATPCVVIRQGDFKLIHFFGDTVDIDHDESYAVGARTELYDLATDLGETHNLAGARPELAERLQRQLMDWLGSLEAPLPTPNPDFDPIHPLVPGKRP